MGNDAPGEDQDGKIVWSMISLICIKVIGTFYS